MYFENGVTVSYKMRDLYEKYLETAAMIRVRISKFIGSRTKSDRTKKKNFNDLKAYVAKTINIGNPDILNPIATALMNNDKNAIKLLITMKNKRTWFSYVTNNFFRAAAKDILNGRPVQRPAYIDADTFNKFFSDVTKRYNALKGRYTFITDATPRITTINGE
jgi:ribosomal protein L17